MSRNEAGNYRFLGHERRPFSSGVVADPGFDIVHATFQRPVSLETGIEAAASHVSRVGRPAQSLTGFELRIPRPLPRAQFDDFNAGYVALLRGIGLDVDGAIPAARTNVAPLMGSVDEPSVFGFSFTAPAPHGRPAFVLSGVPEEVQGDAAAMLANICDILSARAAGLGFELRDSTDIQLYARGAVDARAVAVVERAFGEAAINGLKWFPSLPPIEGLKFEIDARSSGSHVVIAAG